MFLIERSQIRCLPTNQILKVALPNGACKRYNLANLVWILPHTFWAEWTKEIEGAVLIEIMMVDKLKRFAEAAAQLGLRSGNSEYMRDVRLVGILSKLILGRIRVKRWQWVLGLVVLAILGAPILLVT